MSLFEALFGRHALFVLSPLRTAPRRRKVKGKSAMKKPAVIKVVRRAYQLWEKAGRPEGRDQEFYHQAERELEGELEGNETPEDI